ncbi:Aldo/keto reductase [Chryseobacterium arachidis]|uniref:Aldo/keto reductase n=1 Tax=Chryseobacterium arachidis TaxID=1416778 RepID=A0A1M5MED2_9FLAO|nr:aldo/keto reductase [Chryseobacterium arachidis]SHG75754.1 Aldo/keto reductase [Chryseobacterium arachidis]
MIYKTIPSSGELLPVIGLGTWQSFDTKHDSDIINLSEIVSAWAEHGGRLIDSSPMYGKAEEAIGDITHQSRYGSELFYATKVWAEGRQAGEKQIEDSFIKMKRKTIDLLQIHNLVDWKTHLPFLKELKQAGKIRYIGLTHYTDRSHDQLVELIKSEDIDFVQFNYSLFNRNAEKKLLDTALDRGVATIINRPFGEGSVLRNLSRSPLPEWVADLECSSWAGLILKYIISHPAVTCVIPATTSKQHILENVKAGSEELLTEVSRNKIVEYLKSI